MKIYKASYRDSYSEHQGYEYFSNRKDAEKAQTKNNKSRYERDELDETIDGKPIGQTFDEVEVIEFEPTKSGIIEMLNIHCSYADNG